MYCDLLPYRGGIIRPGSAAVRLLGGLPVLKTTLLRTSKGSFLVAVLCCGLAPAQSSSSVSGRIVAGANAFLSSLDEGQRSKVLFAFDDAAQRVKWSNLPSTTSRSQGPGAAGGLHRVPPQMAGDFFRCRLPAILPAPLHRRIGNDLPL